MRNELVAGLLKTYPQALAVSSDEQSLPVIDCGDGWLKIVETLCELLQRKALVTGQSSAKITYIKEKFGELRIAMDSACPITTEWIAFTSAHSLRTCEICGNSGQLLSTDKWVRTRCQDHQLTPRTWP